MNDFRESKEDHIEREREPIYACTTIKLKDDRITSLYRKAMDEILQGQRATEFGYMDGMNIYSQDLTREEKFTILKITANIFNQKGVTTRSCYVDICGPDIVNYGLYFADDSGLEKVRRSFRGNLQFTFVSDLQVDGTYKHRESGDLGVGHDVSEPHIKIG